MRILILSAEVWKDSSNGGNVLSNIFSEMNVEIAQIYCNPGEPQNNACRLYYQMTDSMIIKNIIKKHPIGSILQYDDYPYNTNVGVNIAEQENKRFYSFFRKFSFPIFHIAKEVLWLISDWKNDTIKKFVLDFSPDVIFAPCYASHFMLKLTRYVSELINKPVISYVSDDVYSCKQFHISPIYWINRVILRRNIKKTFPYYSLVYTMTEEQKTEYEKIFRVSMKILCKCGSFSEHKEKEPNDPLKIIYAGGVYLNRWKVLSQIRKSLEIINRDGIKAQLYIYTANQLSKKQKKALHDEKNSFVCKAVSLEELKELYAESDIAIHVESFDLKNKLNTRLSFSTKIIDCIESGCAILAIGPHGQAGIEYLYRTDSAVCVFEKSRITDEVKALVENKQRIKDYSLKAYYVGFKYHNKEQVLNMINDDFNDIMNNFNDIMNNH